MPKLIIGFGGWHNHRYIGSEFPVTNARTNFHPRMDHSDGLNNISALICGDAVTTTQRCVRAEHAQDSLSSIETLLSIFNEAGWRSVEAPMQINETIASHGDLAGGAACLQGRRNVQKTALVTVDLVAETPPQSLARVIEPLLRVAHPVQQLPRKRARATVNSSLEIDNIWHN